jgi:hypothetical protein
MAHDLGQVLELLHGSRRRWRTIRASGEEWHDAARGQEAFERTARRGRVMSFRGTPGPVERDPRWRLWVSQPGRARAEFGMPHRRQMTVIADGGRVWTSSPAGGGRSDEAGAEVLSRLGPAGRLLETAALTAILDLEVVDESTVVGRPAIVVRGRPRHDGPPRSWSEAMTFGADEVELTVDADRGVLLATESRYGGAPFLRLSVDAIAFDEDLADDLFELPPDDESTAAQAWAAAAPAPPQLPPPTPADGPPDGVVGGPVAMTAVLVGATSLVVAVDRLVAYPGGFEMGVTVRTQADAVFGSFDAAHPRRWSGASAFPGESLRIGVVFADGSEAWSSNFSEVPEGSGVTLAPLNGSGTQTRFDQRFWVTPLPPPGPLGLVAAWPGRDIPETRVDIPAEPLLEAARRATVLWDP